MNKSGATASSTASRTLRVLFVGESWLGSCARSMREALARQPELLVDDISENDYFPSHRAWPLRGMHRLLFRQYQHEFQRALMQRVETFRPDCLVVYKGHPVRAAFLRKLKSCGVKSINIYPDHSLHASGPGLRAAMAEYDGVISTKVFHPEVWHSLYGYDNPCAFVPQGYDPALHLVAEPVGASTLDVAMAATWRPEYHQLMEGFAVATRGKSLKVGIAGHGWNQHRAAFPRDWTYLGGLHGRSYVEWLRKAKVCLAPLSTRSVDGMPDQLGDVDTTRTYELAAAHCFFIHRRTPYVESLYDEHSEVPLFDTPEELSDKTLHYLAHDSLRLSMALNAHRRAVPAYSNDQRARAIIAILRQWV